MIDPDINEQDALAALVASDGWQVLQAHLEREWGATAYARKMDSTIAAAKAAGLPAEGDICELAAAVRQVQLFARWPSERLKQLKAAAAGRAGSLNPFARHRRA